jgi:hypothetical protein
MRFMILHRTSSHWEGGAIPSPELVARVGALIGELVKAGVFGAGEGLRPSSEGVRLRFSGGTRTQTPGPFQGENELPAAFDVLRAPSLEEAVAWTTQLAKVVGDGEFDIRPVTEPWDIGMAPRPEPLTTRRYMVLHKATARTEAGETREADGLVEESRRTGTYLTGERLRPSSRGRRYKNSESGVTFTDGPFTESKELIAGYVLVSAASLEEAGRWAARYIEAVGADEVDVRELV